MPTSRPRFEGGASSDTYTGTCADSMPTERPLIMRPTISMPIFCEAQMRIEPTTLKQKSVVRQLYYGIYPGFRQFISYAATGTHHTIQPIWMVGLRPMRSDRIPEIKAPSHEPPAMDAVMPPCTSDLGPLQFRLSLKGGPSGPWLK